MHATTVFHRVCDLMGVTPDRPLTQPARASAPRGALLDRLWVEQFLAAEAAAMEAAGLTVYLVLPTNGRPWFDLTWVPEGCDVHPSPLACKFWLANMPTDEGYTLDLQVPTAKERVHAFHFATQDPSIQQLREWFANFIGLSLIGCRSHRLGRLTFEAPRQAAGHATSNTDEAWYAHRGMVLAATDDWRLTSVATPLDPVDVKLVAEPTTLAGAPAAGNKIANDDTDATA